MSDKTLNDVWLMLGQIDSKLDRAVKDGDDHEKRLKALEQDKWSRHGMVALTGTFVSLVVATLAAVFK